MKVVLCSFFSFVFSVTMSEGQIANVIKISGEPIRASRYEAIQGVPYLESGDWQNGSMVDNQGHRFENIPMRYNAFSDELEVKQGATPIIVDRKSLSSFQFTAMDDFGNKQEYVFRNGFSGSDEFDKYTNFRIIYDHEKLKIVERIRKTEIRVTPAAYGEMDYKKFTESNETYLMLKNQWQQTRINQKVLFKVLPDQKDLIKEFIRSKDLKVDDRGDLIALCDYIVSIIP